MRADGENDEAHDGFKAVDSTSPRVDACAGVFAGRMKDTVRTAEGRFWRKVVVTKEVKTVFHTPTRNNSMVCACATG
jgi:hypothetical protein